MESRCIFCNGDNSQEQLMQIQEMKDCRCNPLIHLTCIHKWYLEFGKKCPRCFEEYPGYVAVTVDQVNFLDTRLGTCLAWTFTIFTSIFLISIFFTILFRFGMPRS